MLLFLDGIFGFFMLWMGITGYNRGLIEEFGRLAGLITAILAAMKYYVNLAGFLYRLLSMDPWILLFISFFFIFSVVLISMRFLTRFIHYLLVSRGVKWMNQSFGFLFGVLKGGIIVSVFMWIIELSPMDKWTQIMYDQSELIQFSGQARERVIHFFGIENPAINGKEFIGKMLKSADNNQEKI